MTANIADIGLEADQPPRLPIRLSHVRAARQLRAGEAVEAVRSEFGISRRNMKKIESAYAGIPDSLLAGIERLLAERDQLRHIIASLMPGTTHESDQPPVRQKNEPSAAWLLKSER